MKRILTIVIAMSVILSLTSCGSSTANADEEQTFELIFAGVDAEGIPSTNAIYWMAQEIEARTDGSVTVKVYPGGQLGDYKLMYEGIMDGSIDMMMGYLDATYDLVFDIMSIPFLASNYDEISYMFSEDSNCYALYDEHTAMNDMKFMGFFLNGVNGIFSTKPLGDYMDPSSRKDVLIRIASSTTYKLGIEAMGYPTVTIPWPDTYTSLQTGIMDGMTGIPSYMVDQNFGDITKYFLPLDMFIETNTILMSPLTYERLPDEYTTIIEQICKEAGARSLVETENNVNRGIEALRARDIEIYEVTQADRDALADQIREMTESALIEYFGDELLALVQEDIEHAKQ